VISLERWPSSAHHCLRVGSLSDKKVIEACDAHFDVLVVQGNLAVSAPQGLATWPLQKPVWIDPITYAFAASPAYLRSSGKDGGYKKTFVKLADAFGAPFTTALQDARPLAPDDFGDIPASVERVLAWQESVFAPPQEDVKYGATALTPVLLTVPFMPLTIREPGGTVSPPWLSANLAMIRAAAGIRDPSRLAAAFLAELDVLDHPSFDPWFTTYLDVLAETRIEHLWWWVSDHDELHTSLQRAALMLESFAKLEQCGIAVHQAFGGSLSSFALGQALTSVGHGVNYWESKGWEPIASGGLPTARYFHPGLRERLRVPEAIAIIEHRVGDAVEFYEHVCACDVCRRVVGDDVADFGAFGEVNIKTRRTRGGGTADFDSPTAEALYLTKAHYLHAKGIEVALALSDGFDAPGRLHADAEFWASDLTRTRHLDRWALALAV
jgi:hypothetical protein